MASITESGSGHYPQDYKRQGFIIEACDHDYDEETFRILNPNVFPRPSFLILEVTPPVGRAGIAATMRALLILFDEHIPGGLLAAGIALVGALGLFSIGI